MDFQKFRKIPRLKKDCTITEKLDGSNAQVVIMDYNTIEENSPYENLGYDIIEEFVCAYSLSKQGEYYMFAGSRSRWLGTSKQDDNYGFAKWAQGNAEELFKLGSGRFYGEWMGQGIQRNYGLKEKKFVLFNAKRVEELPKCCEVVPILYEGKFSTKIVDNCLFNLEKNGSYFVPGYMKPEGIVIYHKASHQLFKQTLEGDSK